MARPRNRSNSKQHRKQLVNLYSSATALGFIVAGLVHVVEGLEMVRAGMWAEVYDDAGRLRGFQPLVVPVGPAAEGELSRATLVAPEIRANAGLLGKSRTVRMSEPEKLARQHPKSGRLLPAEDFVERVQQLMRVYAEERAQRRYPRVTVDAAEAGVAPYADIPHQDDCL